MALSQKLLFLTEKGYLYFNAKKRNENWVCFEKLEKKNWKIKFEKKIETKKIF